MKERQPDDPYETSAYRFWFLVKNGEPQLCLETSGYAWTLTGQQHDLQQLYSPEHRVWPLVWQVAGDLLP